MGRYSLNIRKFNILMLLVIIIFSGFLSVNVSIVEVKAESWVDHNAKIYNQKEPKVEDSENNSFTYNDEIDGSGQSGPVKFFADFCYEVADIVHRALESLGFDIDSIVLGRLQYDSGDINLFGFEFAPKNPYGVVASIVYVIIRSIVFLVLALQVQYIIVKNGLRKTARTRENLKEELISTLLMFIALVLMPYIFDLFIYGRDVLLSGIRKILTSMIGISSLDMWDAFSYAYEQSGGSIIVAALCLGTAVLSFVFIGSYVLIALTMVVLFISFAFLCADGPMKRKRALEEWMSMVLANLLVPIIDYTLIMVVALFPILAGNNIAAYVVQLFIASFILKARGIFFNTLSLRTAQPINGVGGLIGLMSAGRLLKNGIDALRESSDKIRSSLSDRRAAKQEEELADLPDNEYDRAFDSNYASNQESYNYGSEDSEEKYASNDMPEESDSLGEPQKMGGDELGSFNDEDTLNDADIDEQPVSYDELQADNSYLRNRNKDINEQIGRNKANIDRNNEDIDKIEESTARSRAELDSLNENGQGGSEQAQKLIDKISNGESKISDKKSINEQLAKKNADLEQERRNNRAQIESNFAQMSSGRQREGFNVSGANSGNASGYGARLTNRFDSNTASERDKQIHEIAKKRANVDNFTTPQFDGLLSHKEMADFYRKRSRKNMISAATGIGGFTTGSVLGMAAGTWLGPSAMAEMGNIGGTAGKAIGNVTGGLAYGVGSKLAQYRRNTGTMKMGNESGNIKSEIKNAMEWRDLPKNGMEHFHAQDILNSGGKEGEFMIRMNERRRTLEERVSANARNAAKYYNESPENKAVIYDSILQRYEMAVKNRQVASDNVAEEIRKEYSAGIEQLSEKERADTLAWIEEITNEFNRRRSK